MDFAELSSRGFDEASADHDHFGNDSDDPLGVEAGYAGRDTAELADRMRAFVTEGLNTLVQGFLPDGHVPSRLAGMRLAGDTVADLAHVVGLLPDLGIYDVAGRDVEELLLQLLQQVDGGRLSLVGVYRLAETIARFGAWDGHPLIDELSDAARADLLHALQAGRRADHHDRSPLEWAVLLRCEYALGLLGLTDDGELFDHALAICQERLTDNPHGFIDDSRRRLARYDLGGAEMMLVLEPLFDRFERPVIDACLSAQETLLDQCHTSVGSMVAWGRNNGLYGIGMTIELATLLLTHERSRNPAAHAALIDHAFQAQAQWWEGGLVTAHRDRAPYRYRGLHCLLQFSADLLGRLATALMDLEHLDQAVDLADPPDPEQAKQPTDRLLAFDDAGASVWLYSNERLHFQMPLLGGLTADYLPWLFQPGCFEMPVDSTIVCGVPVVVINGRSWTVNGPPQDIAKTPNILSVRYDGLRPIDGEGDPIPAAIRIVHRANGNVFHVQHDWQVDGLNEASLCIPEAGTPMRVEVDDQAITALDVQGLPEWRSFWGQIKRVHETDLPLVRAGHMQCTVRVTLV